MSSNSDTMTSPDKENESHEGITVAIRMRPLNKAEGDGKRRVWKTLKKYNSVAQTTLDGKPLSERISGRNFFTFDRVFGEDDKTVQIYDSVVKGIVSSFVNGLNGTIFAYGQTSSGKTYTMQGSGSIADGATSNGGGVVHMAAKDIFSHIQSQPNRIFLVRASFLEIYNEEVRDLLSSSSQNLQIREDPRRGVFVQSHEEMVTDFESLLKILFEGEKSRAIASTGMNERSSRSHTIFRITIESREKESDDGGDDTSESGEDGAVRVSTLNLVDLAGSESVRHTGATGERQKEGGMINQSLLTLSRVIVALGQPNQMHINFRDSKLTRILQPSLSGNARMAVICCATPSELYLEETRSTLQFASRAKLVKTNAQVNEVLDDRSIIRRLQRELAAARGGKAGPGTEQLVALENKAASAGTAALEAKEKLSRLKASILNASYLFSGNGNALGSEAVLGNKRKQYNLRSRKRRQSDGGGPQFSVSISSPNRSVGKVVSSPQTAPRKKTKIHPTLSPRDELSILRQALSSRNELSRLLKASLQENTKILSDKEAEVNNLNSEKDGLAEEKDHAYVQLSNMQDALASVQANLDATISEYDVLIAEKEKIILEAFQNVQIENAKVVGLEDTNAKLLDQLRDLEKRFDALQEERVRSAFELAHSTEEKEKLLSEREQDKITVNEMNQKIGILMTAANHAETERKASQETICELQQQLIATTGEKTTAFEKVGALEVDLARLRDETEVERQAAQETRDELEARLESLREENKCGLSRNAELEEVIRQAGVELAAVQERTSEAMSELESKCEILQTKLSEREREAEVSRTEAEETIRDLQIQMSGLSKELATVQSSFVGLRTQVTAKEIEKSELVNQVGGLKSELDALRLDRIELESNVDALRQIEISLRAELNSSNERLRQREAECEKLERMVSELEDDAATERKASQETIRELQQQLIATTGEKTTAFEKVGALEVDLARLRDETEVERQAAQETRDELEARLESLREENKCGLSRNAELEEVIRQAGVELAAVQERTSEAMSELESKCEILQTKLSEREREAEVSRTEAEETIRDLQIQMSGLSKELATVQSSFVGLRTQVTAKEIEKSELVNQVGGLKSELDALRLDRIELESNVDALRQIEISLRAELNSSNERLLHSKSDGDALLNEKEHMLSATAAANNELRNMYDALRVSNDELESRYNTLAKENVSLEAECDDLREKFLAAAEEKDELGRFLAAAEEEIAIAKEQKSALENELSNLQASNDESDRTLKQCQADLELVSRARENAQATLRDREKERDEAVCALEKLYEKNHELSTKLANSISIEKEASAQKEMAELKQSNVELTKLLASSTGSEGRLRLKVANLESELIGKSRELEDSNYRLSQLEDELRQSELAFEEKLLLNPCENSSGHHVELLHEIESLQKAIAAEKSERRAVEESLKRQMGEEQRLLLQEGERLMEALRCKVTELEDRLRESEAEAYACREQLQEVQEQKVVAERNCTVLAATLDEVKAAATREEGLASSLEAALSKAKAEIYSLKENAVDLKNKVRIAEAQAQKLEQEKDATHSQITLLKNQLNKKSAENSDTLRAEVVNLKAKIKEKDQRIKKLQTFKLTKEFAEEYRQLKKDNISLREEQSRLQSDVASLQSQLQSTESDTGLRTEVSALRFDNEALEKKLRKFAAHCQRLEDDKAGIASALRSCNIMLPDVDGDVNEAVISLCDMLTSLQETESVRSGRSSGGRERLESENAALQSKLEQLNDKISRYKSEVEDLRKKLKGKGGAESCIDSGGETSRKLRYLEQENLQLMFDVKTTKKQLQAAREEIEVLRMNAMENSTLDFGTVDLGSDSSQLSKVVKPHGTNSQPPEFPKKSTKAPLSDKTNASSKKNPLKDTMSNQIGQKQLGQTTQQINAPGLGEAGVQGDETGECNQS